MSRDSIAHRVYLRGEASFWELTRYIRELQSPECIQYYSTSSLNSSSVYLVFPIQPFSTSNMMFSTFTPIALTLAFAASATAGLISSHDSTALTACEAAPNCETYNTDFGMRIRFKPGMEPGSEDYKSRFANATEPYTLSKRAKGITTHTTIGKSSISYFTTSPTDALWKCMYQQCK
jgi:hypothetical protein